VFTGLVRERGLLATDPVSSAQGGRRLRLTTSAELASSLAVGASLAVAGVCLTIVSLGPHGCELELAPETLARTRLGDLRGGDEVNLEPSLRLGDPLGGHWVQGHVDGTVAVLAVEALGDHRVMTLELPPPLAPSVVEKGSVAVDGVSLTVSAVSAASFAVALIPHTLAVTTLGSVAAGDRLHLELDVLGKYVQRAVAAHLAARGGG
jgi:riboflavin synthase alpha subunit